MNLNIELLDAEIFLLAVTTITAILAFIQSSIALYKTNAPISITLDKTPFFDTGMIGYYDDNLQFIPVFASGNKGDGNQGDLDLCVLTLRIVNPKSYPITLFNIFLSNENKDLIPYEKQIHATFLDPNMKLFAKCQNNTFGITLPYSHYITIPPGSFSHLDIVTYKSELYNSKKLYLTFRDSSKAFLKRKNRRIAKGARLNHPLHSYKFHLDAKP